MKNLLLFSFFVTLIMSQSSCLKDRCESSKTYISYAPIYKTPTELRSEVVKMEAAREIKNPGKIYSYDRYLLVNELREGLHIIDNQNPSSPVSIGFLKIGGNQDMAVKGNILYADNYIDLLAIDLTNITSPQVVKRREDAFQPLAKDATRGYLVGYSQEKVSVPCNSPISYYEGEKFFLSESVFLSDNSNFGSSASGTSVSVPAGIGGSQARFTLYNNYLYAVDNRDLRTFNIETLANPYLVSTTTVGWNIETIFPYKDKLFIGSATGMFIYDNAVPTAPKFLSQFTHARACDPVYATDTRAYVTLHQGTNCGGSVDALDVIDISNLSAPKLLRSYSMYSPKGLAVTNNKLYLCDDGLKVFDISNDLTIDDHKLSHLKGFDSYDVIHLASKNVLLVVGKDGLYQYDSSNPSDLKQLSKIGVAR